MNHVVVEIHWEMEIFGQGEDWRWRQTRVARASLVVDTKSVAGDTMAVWTIGACFGGRGTGRGGVGGACLDVRKVVVVVFRSDLWCGARTKLVKFRSTCRRATTGSATVCVIGKPTAASTRTKSFVDNAPWSVVARV